MSILNNYSDEDFAQAVQQSISIRDCMQKLGYNSVSGSVSQLIKNRIEQLQLDTSHFTARPVKRNADNVFVENSTADQATLRRWYKSGAYSKYECAICHQPPLWNGKSLTLILDHINGKNHDDRLENLRWVCPNCNQQLDTTGSRNQQKQKQDKIPTVCIDCGKIITHQATRCAECALKYRNAQSQSLISRDQLKQLIRTTPFTTIGKQYNVSDNAVRKWCDKYNLPRKTSEIKSYSDEEWEQL